MKNLYINYIKLPENVYKEISMSYNFNLFINVVPIISSY
ncbi:hypothetical protein YN1_6200 [Nanoarchaeota archaeon]